MHNYKRDFILELLLGFLILIGASSCNSYGDECPSDEAYKSKAPKIQFTDIEKLRVPYKQINKLKFIKNDTLVLTYNKSSSWFEYSTQCDRRSGSCPKAKSDCGNYEFEEYYFDAPALEKIHLIHYINRSRGAIIKLEWDDMTFEMEASFLDTIAQYPTMSVGTKIYTNIYLMLLKSYMQTDSVFYNKEFGIIRVRYSDGSDIKLLEAL